MKKETVKSEGITLPTYRYELLDDTECVVAVANRLKDLAYAQALEYCVRPLFYDTVRKKCVPAPEKESH